MLDERKDLPSSHHQPILDVLMSKVYASVDTPQDAERCGLRSPITLRLNANRKGQYMKQTLAVLALALAAAGCHATASGVVTDTKANTTAVKGAVETLD